jgi:NAD(P)-dependent dehydrogenase (short-subunit alcohol dehydrogenase family)
LDISNEAQAKAAGEETVNQFGRIDVGLNNGGYSSLGNFEEMTTAEIERQFATNFYGVMYVMRAAMNQHFDRLQLPKDYHRLGAGDEAVGDEAVS